MKNSQCLLVIFSLYCICYCNHSQGYVNELIELDKAGINSGISSKKLASNRRTAKELYRKGAELFQGNDYSKAENNWFKSAKADVTWWKPLYGLARISARKRELGHARLYLSLAFDRELPDNFQDILQSESDFKKLKDGLFAKEIKVRFEDTIRLKQAKKEMTRLGLNIGQESLNDLRSRKIFMLFSSEVGVNINDEHLLYFSALPNLEELIISGRHLSDDCIKYLDNYSKLRVLNISGTKITGSGFPKLKNLNIEKIKFRSNLRPVSIADLSRLPNLKSLHLHKTSFQYDKLGNISPNPSFTRIIFEHSGIKDSDISYLLQFKTLSSFTFKNEHITKNALSYFHGNRIREIRLQNVGVMNDDVASLYKVTDLRILEFKNTKVDAKGLTVIKKMPQLERIVLYDVPLKDDDLYLFSNSKSLRSLVLSNTNITGSGVTHLSKLKNLESLGISESPTGDIALKHVSKMQSIKSLSFNNTNITDSGLQYLKNLDGLHSFFALNTSITHTGMSKFESEMPQLEVFLHD